MALLVEYQQPKIILFDQISMVICTLITICIRMKNLYKNKTVASYLIKYGIKDVKMRVEVNPVTI